LAYSDEAMREILRVCPSLPNGTHTVDIINADGNVEPREFEPSEALRLKLICAYRLLAFQEPLGAQPTPREQLEIHREIQRSAAKLAKALRLSNVPDDPDVPSWLRYGSLQAEAASDTIAAARVVHYSPPNVRPTVRGGELLRSAIWGVVDLERWSTNQVERWKLNVENAKKRPPEKPKTMRAAQSEWAIELANIWRDVFRKIDDAHAFGRFVRAAGDPIGLTISADAARKVLPRVRIFAVPKAGNKRRKSAPHSPSDRRHPRA